VVTLKSVKTEWEFDMQEKYVFSSAEWGKFYAEDAVFNVPIYLEPDVNDYMTELAEEKDIDVQTLVNEWLRTNIRLQTAISSSRNVTRDA